MPHISPSIVIQDSLFDIRYSHKHAGESPVCGQRRGIRFREHCFGSRANRDIFGPPSEKLAQNTSQEKERTRRGEISRPQTAGEVPAERVPRKSTG